MQFWVFNFWQQSVIIEIDHFSNFLKLCCFFDIVENSVLLVPGTGLANTTCGNINKVFVNVKIKGLCKTNIQWPLNIYLIYNRNNFPYITCISAKSLHNIDTVSVHSSHFYCTEICDKLRRDYVNLHISQRGWVLINIKLCPNKGLTYKFLSLMLILKKKCSWSVDCHVIFNLVGVHSTLLLPYSINNDRHSPVCMTG